MKKTTFLLIMSVCLLLSGCNKTSESFRFEGKSDKWTVFTNIPYTLENDDKYLKVTFICSSIDHIFSESDITSFGIGTAIGSIVYSYSKTDGYIKNEYSSDPVDLERITYDSEDTFEVLYDITIIDTSKKDWEQSIDIQIQVADEKIVLLPVE